MKHWNYRIIKQYNEEINEWSYAIHSVYYNRDGKPSGLSVDPSYPSGDTLEELREDLLLYSHAFEKPVLNWNDFVNREEPSTNEDI